MDFEQDRVTAWDGRQKYIEELSEIRKHLHRARMLKDYRAHFDLLTCYFQALIACVPRQKKKSQEENKDWRDQVDIRNKVTAIFHDYQSYENRGMRYPEMKSLITSIESWETALRQLESDLGLLMPKEGNPGEAIFK